MSETPVQYKVYTSETRYGIVDTELDTVRAELEELERRLIPLLVTVQRALGKEPSIVTRANTRHK